MQFHNDSSSSVSIDASPSGYWDWCGAVPYFAIWYVRVSNLDCGVIANADDINADAYTSAALPSIYLTFQF